MEVAIVEAQAAAEGPAVEGLAGGGVNADVEEVVGRDEELFAFVQRALVHTADASRELPAFEGVIEVAGIIGEGVEEEVEAGAIVVVGMVVIILDGKTVEHTSFVVVGVIVVVLFKFLTAVLLVADDGFEEAIAEDEGGVEDGLVVVDLLIGYWSSS